MPSSRSSWFESVTRSFTCWLARIPLLRSIVHQRVFLFFSLVHVRYDGDFAVSRG